MLRLRHGGRFWVALALLAVALSARADDYRRSYLDGVKALARGQWREAERLLAAAVAERPQEQARARLVGAIPEPYLPHHYLGVAFFNQHQCERALAEWGLSERQGAIGSRPELAAQASQGRGACQGLLDAEAEVARAAAVANSLPAPTDEVWRREGALAERRERALATLSSARARLGEARDRWRPAEARPAFELAAGAARDLAALGAELEARGRQAREERQRAEAAPAPSPTAEPALEVAPGAEDQVVAPPLPTAESPASARAPLPSPVLAAAQAYFDGEYQRAVELLERQSAPASDRVMFYTALFRSAARHALFLLGGEAEADLLAAAVDDLREARRLNPTFAPHPDAFSPRFIELFRDNP